AAHAPKEEEQQAGQRVSSTVHEAAHPACKLEAFRDCASLVLLAFRTISLITMQIIRGSVCRRPNNLPIAFNQIETDLCVRYSRTAVQQQSIEGIRIQKIERAHHNIGRQMLAIVTYADAAHPGREGTLNTCDGIFNNNAAIARYSDAFRGE